MKKKILLLTLLIFSVFSTVAMAQEEQKIPQGYKKYVGTVKVTSKSGQILIGEKDSKKDDRIIFNTKGVIIVDANNAERVDNHNFKVGEDVAVFLRNDTPVALSLPPVTTPQVIVLNPHTVQYSYDVDYFNKSGEGLSKRINIPYTIKKDTKCVDLKERNVKKDSIHDRDLIVFYKKSTRSIPPIAVPEKIMLMVKVEKEEAKVPESIFESKKTVDDLYNLRSVFLDLGAKVGYEKATKRIKIEKDNMICYIALSDKMAIVNGEAFEPEMEVKKGITYISKESVQKIWQAMNKFNIVEKELEYLDK